MLRSPAQLAQLLDRFPVERISERVAECASGAAAAFEGEGRPVLLSLVDKLPSEDGSFLLGPAQFIDQYRFWKELPEQTLTVVDGTGYVTPPAVGAVTSEYGALQNELQTSQLSLKALRQELTQASGPPPTISADLPEAS